MEIKKIQIATELFKGNVLLGSTRNQDGIVVSVS
jgi:hypothetical protein